MTDQITPEIFKHIVELAALELMPQEAEYLRRELNNQLRAVYELEQIPLADDTPLASHGVTYTPEISQELRPDEWQPWPNPGEILAQAPDVDDGYIVVPDIPHTELS